MDEIDEYMLKDWISPVEFEIATAVVYAHVNQKLYFSLQNNADNLCNKFTFFAFFHVHSTFHLYRATTSTTLLQGFVSSLLPW